MVARDEPSAAEVPRDVLSETFDVLRKLGHGETDARRLLDTALSKKKQFKDVESLLHAIYQQSHE
jgi:Holliday junction DNA helicase RuvA